MDERFIIDLDTNEVNVTQEVVDFDISLDSKRIAVSQDDVDLTIDVVEVPKLDFLFPEGPPGPPGADSTVPGPPGPPGPQGEAGEQTTFAYTQVSPDTIWSIDHFLHRFPAVTVVDSGGSEVIPDLFYLNADQVMLRFDAITSGKAYLN